MDPEEFRSSELGRCDFLDVLEEAAIFGGIVAVVLRDGHAFEDIVADVITEHGREIVRFLAAGRIPLSQIASATRGVKIQR